MGNNCCIGTDTKQMKKNDSNSNKPTLTNHFASNTYFGPVKRRNTDLGKLSKLIESDNPNIRKVQIDLFSESD